MAQENTARVITIAATEQPQDIRLRVAAYARVSSSSDEQLNSFAAQNRYYTELISSKDNWQLVDIYADEGITGTSIEKRDEFKRMLRDCERGLIDRILVKSISRFARNTTECLETVRSLKARGVSVYFEKEGIDTGKVSGEMLTAVFASLAQAESESISKNLRWSYQKRMQAGEFVPPFLPYGFKRDNREMIIDVSEAAVIRRIFDMYVSGISFEDIAECLNRYGIPYINSSTDRKWSRSTIGHIIENEKYAGNSLWQKSYTTNTLPRVQRKNKGEQPQYYVGSSHEAIIDKDTFEAAQALRSARKSEKHIEQYNQPNPFRKKIVCGHCGSPFRIKRSSGGTYWICRQHAEDKGSCPVMQVPECQLEAAFMRLYYKLKIRSDILKQMQASLTEIRNRRMLWSPDIIGLNKRISDILSQNQMLAVLKQQGLVDPDIFISKTNELTKELHELKIQKEKLLCSERDEAIIQTRAVIDIVNSEPEFLEEFDSELFGELITKIIIHSNICVEFELKNGLRFTERIERLMC